MPDIKGENIYFIKDRVKVYHSSFFEVEATIRLMEFAAADPCNEYFVLLSGADYPVRSNTEINEKLRSGGEFVQVLAWPNEYHPSSYFKYYYFNRVNRRSYDLKKKIFVSIERLLRKLRIKKKIPFQIYTGSQWFALSVECAKHILSAVKCRKEYGNFFRSCRFPCESFFQTIIGNSRFKEKIRNKLTYVDFTKKGVAEISIDHIQEIEKGDYLFARKFNDNSIEIVNMIEKQRQ